MHSSYQLNTVFTDVYLLLLQNYKLAQVATWLTSRYSYGTTLLWDLFSVEPQGEGLTEADQLHGRKAADGHRVCLRLGSIEETEANHTVYATPGDPGAALLLHMFHFSEFLTMKAKLSIPPKNGLPNVEVGGL